MTKIEKIKKVLKSYRGFAGLTMADIVKRSSVAYPTARRHVTRLLERNEIQHGDYQIVNEETGRYQITYKVV
jgi:predicted ArsR family transcriptional regulator